MERDPSVYQAKYPTVVYFSSKTLLFLQKCNKIQIACNLEIGMQYVQKS